MKELRSQVGLSFVEVLILLGITGILVSGTIGFSSFVFNLKQSIVMSDEVHLRHGEIRAYLSDAGNCSASFFGMGVKGVLDAGAGLQSGVVGNNHRDFTTDDTSRGGVVIERFLLDEAFLPDDPAQWQIPLVQRIRLFVDYAQQGNVIGKQIVRMNILLAVLTNNVGQIQQCRAVSSLNSDVWIGMGNATTLNWDSYFRMGFVGINIPVGGLPTTLLDVNGATLITQDLDLDLPQPFVNGGINFTAEGINVQFNDVLLNQAYPAHAVALLGKPPHLISDRRLKSKIAPFHGDPMALLRLRPARFRYKGVSSHSIGFIAQDVEKVYPEFVTKGPQGKLAIQYGPLVVLTIEVVKKLNHEKNLLQDKLSQVQDKTERLLGALCQKERYRVLGECQGILGQKGTLHE